jgi:hypothetical protein
LLLLAGAGVLIIFLAMSLPTLHLSEGKPFTLAQPASGGSLGAATLEGGDLLYWVVRGFVAFALIFLPIYIIQSMMSKRGRQRLIFYIIVFAALFYLADYLHNHPLDKKEEEQPPVVMGSQEIDGQTGQTPTEFLADPPSWLTIAIIATASVITVLVIVLVLVIIQRRRRKAPPTALEKLAETAQNTVAAIQSGGDFKLSVIRCYQQMMQVVKEEKGIAREASMTTREFEDQLIRRGMPQDAIRTLTRLFEQVRYGSLPSTPQDEELAVTSLSDIAIACGSQWSRVRHEDQ